VDKQSVDEVRKRPQESTEEAPAQPERLMEIVIRVCEQQRVSAQGDRFSFR
jgi:hypothetical protein